VMCHKGMPRLTTASASMLPENKQFIGTNYDMKNRGYVGYLSVANMPTILNLSNFIGFIADIDCGY
jgi:hypothetical protein